MAGEGSSEKIKPILYLLNLNLILQFDLTRPCGHFDPHPCQSDPLDLDHDHSLMSCCATMWLF